MAKPVIAFRSFANAPKTRTGLWLPHCLVSYPVLRTDATFFILTAVFADDSDVAPCILDEQLPKLRRTVPCS